MIFPPKLNLFYISHGRAKHLWVFWLPELVVDPKGPGLYLLKNERIAFFWDIFSERKKQTDRQTETNSTKLMGSGEILSMFQS